MDGTKKLRRLALVTIIVSGTGCQSTTGLSTLNLNPFNRAASSEQEPKVAVVTVPGGKTNAAATESEGFTGMLAAAGTRARDLVGGAFSFGASAPIDDPTKPTDALSLTNTPNNLGPEVYVANGQLWESSGSFDRAIENYAKALEVDPENGPALGAIARLNDRQNNLDESVSYFGRAIEADPSEPTLYNDLGLVLARQKKYDEAVAQIQKAIAIAPANKRFANNLATVYMDAGDSSQAMATLEKAHEPAVAHYNMAYLNFKRQQVGEARNELETALKIDPTLEPARNLLDKLGGTQIAQVTKETLSAATSVTESVKDVSQGVQDTYRALTEQPGPVTASISSGVAEALAPYGAPAPYTPLASESVPSIGVNAPQAETPPAPTSVVPAADSTPTTPATTTPTPAAAAPAVETPASGNSGFAMPPAIGG
ncbi:photosystem I assembly protein Ycf3 [Rosistilla ulvae]|uniref:Photosystem I assembly protein Ycf3 n=1 Tax=Rosistilla ulvae TaxID=1930277 RepID=A0A517M1M2_9BACT|nr:tetratricopeptide repeat protein [Rosistilla ulvae]QDS88719.1 photosystem I assembly protein Ycf3 [Rosistilla ulvae]